MHKNLHICWHNLTNSALRMTKSLSQATIKRPIFSYIEYLIYVYLPCPYTGIRVIAFLLCSRIAKYICSPCGGSSYDISVAITMGCSCVSKYICSPSGRCTCRVSITITMSCSCIPKYICPSSCRCTYRVSVIITMSCSCIPKYVSSASG